MNKPKEEVHEVFIDNKKVLLGHKYVREHVKNIPDVKENAHIFEKLASSADKDIREAVSKKIHLTKKAVIILGFIGKFTYYDETHN